MGCLEEPYRQLIAQEFLNCVLDTIERVQGRQAIAQAHRNPFQEILLPEAAIFWSRFERSFSTSFGQRLVETVSRYVALATGAESAETQKRIGFELSRAELENISTHIRHLRTQKLGRKPNWPMDLASVQAQDQRTIPVQSTFDLWFRRHGMDHYVSIKTVKPNIDQAAVAKEEMLKIKCAFPSSQVYFGLYYNPYGENRVAYNHHPSFTVFDMHRDGVVLIGRDYWDTIGKPGTYEEVLTLAKAVQQPAQEALNRYLERLGGHPLEPVAIQGELFDQESGSENF
ncbi:MAG: TdeIII family type II restriction endonuclease [Oscillatoriales cyanobacterium SM2_3_0]|nr:TdeIII family type II restriction endonuclease [Oscillatoriales cyanobacterium SM2_3_0]